METSVVQRHMSCNLPASPPSGDSRLSTISSSPRSKSVNNSDAIKYESKVDEVPLDFSVKRVPSDHNVKNDDSLLQQVDVTTSSVSSNERVVSPLPLLKPADESTKPQQQQQQQVAVPGSIAASVAGLHVMPVLDPLVYSRLSLSSLSMSSPDGVVSAQTPSAPLNQQQAEAFAAAQIQMLMLAENKRRQLLQLQAMAARVQASTPTITPSATNNNNNNISTNGNRSDRLVQNVSSSSGVGVLSAQNDVHSTGRKRGRTYTSGSVQPMDSVDDSETRSVSADSGGKDPSYLERRRKNNEAAKRSRDARRAKEEEVALKACLLEEENKQLRIELASLKQEIGRLKQLLFMCQVPIAAVTSANGTS
jgi:hypothetical protein